MPRGLVTDRLRPPPPTARSCRQWCTAPRRTWQPGQEQPPAHKGGAGRPGRASARRERHNASGPLSTGLPSYVRPRHHLITASDGRTERAGRFRAWKAVTGMPATGWPRSARGHPHPPRAPTRPPHRSRDDAVAGRGGEPVRGRTPAGPVAAGALAVRGHRPRPGRDCTGRADRESDPPERPRRRRGASSPASRRADDSPQHPTRDGAMTRQPAGGRRRIQAPARHDDGHGHPSPTGVPTRTQRPSPAVSRRRDQPPHPDQRLWNSPAL